MLFLTTMIPSLSPKPTAFTLIELLVVIAIIGVLMGLLFPAVNGALDTARKSQAQNDVVQIANAITMYETEYGRLPASSATPPTADQTAGASTNGIIGILMGLNTNQWANPRRIVFLEVPDAKGKKSGINTNSGNYVDPWGGTYRIVLDYDYNNSVTAGEANAVTNSITLRKKVAVWNTNTNTRRRVSSW
jgi:prepilin-type N-terminal cleavage/methylation domain-containing protein